MGEGGREGERFIGNYSRTGRLGSIGLDGLNVGK
jgi:hypothetical protein